MKAKILGIAARTPENYVWPIALAMEGMATKDKAEKERILDFISCHRCGDSFDA